MDVIEAGGEPEVKEIDNKGKTVEEKDEQLPPDNEESSDEDETQEDETEDEQDENDEDESDDNDEDTQGKARNLDQDDEFKVRPTLKDIKAKYPDIFKDFPALRDMYWREQKITEVFATVEEASEAKEELQSFRNLEAAFDSGKLEDTKFALEAIKSIDDATLPNLALNFLPALRELDQNSYYAAITPELVGFVKSLYDAGVRNGNENSKNAALVASLHFFGDKGVATGEKAVNIPKPKVKEETKEDKTAQERKAFQQERHEALFQDVSHDFKAELTSEIKKDIDPDEVMTDFTKNALVETILKRINKTLANDPSHTARMSSLWKQAAQGGFARNWKDRIVNAALSRAKTIMPQIRAKARAEALGTRQRQSNKVLNSKKGTERVPNNSTNRGGVTKTNLGSLDTKKIDWKGSSDLDILNGKVKLK